MTKCAENCNENDRAILLQRTLVDEYICVKKIEEFRVAKECVQSQDSGTIDQCSTSCSYPTAKAVQLGIITLTEAVNPAAYFEALSPTCRSLECTIKCSVKELNKKCAGSGELFKEVGKKEVTETNTRLQASQNDSNTPIEGHIAGVFLDAVPDQCAYLTDPEKFDTLFVEEDYGAEMPTQVATMYDELATTTPQGDTEEDAKIKPKFGEVDEETSTRIFEIAIEPETAAPPTSSNESPENAPTEYHMEVTTEASVSDNTNRYDIVLRPSNGKSEDVQLLEGIVEHPENQPAQNAEHGGKQEVVEPAKEVTDLEAQSSDIENKKSNNVTEKTIRVVDDDGDQGEEGEVPVRRANGAPYWSLFSVISLILAVFCITH